MRLVSIAVFALLVGAAACDDAADSVTATIAPYKAPCNQQVPPPPGTTCWLITDDGGQPRQSYQWFRNGGGDYQWGEELRVRYHIVEATSDVPCGGDAFPSCHTLDEVEARTPAAAGTRFELSLPTLSTRPWFEATATGLRFDGVESLCEPALCDHVLALGGTAFTVQFEFTGDLAVPLRVLAPTP